MHVLRHRVLRLALRAVEQRQPAEVRGHLVRVKVSSQGQGKWVCFCERTLRVLLCREGYRPFLPAGLGGGVSGWVWRRVMTSELSPREAQAQVEVRVVSVVSPSSRQRSSTGISIGLQRGGPYLQRRRMTNTGRG